MDVEWDLGLFREFGMVQGWWSSRLETNPNANPRDGGQAGGEFPPMTARTAAC